MLKICLPVHSLGVLVPLGSVAESALPLVHKEPTLDGLAKQLVTLVALALDELVLEQHLI